jgi:hypothetical protein
MLLFFISALATMLDAFASNPLRRPISPDQPVWLIHIDTWNYPDPQKIIDLIPSDIRPYVVMNISLSMFHDTTGRYKVVEYAYETAKSWLRTCAENRMWAMVQCASGGYARFSDLDLTQSEEFFRNYPNFLGFNYAEQFWGFDEADPLSSKWSDRMNHFADLLQLSNKYGGYLVVSWCGNEWGQSINPIGMLKRNAAFASACQRFNQNYILCDKYTQAGYLNDQESLCLGAYVSGYSGQYGIRYDGTGWTDAVGLNQNFTLATGIAPHLEHLLLNGATVIDGPEIIWTECFKSMGTSTTVDGFTRRNWTTFQHFDNIQVDMFRKILDGTIRIPEKREVINRTGYVVVNDVASGTDNEVYCSPQTLFDGLYAMNGESNYQYNHSFFKKSGRYPTIPTVYKLNVSDSLSNTFRYPLNKTAYTSRWPNTLAKVTEMNTVFPVQSSGDLFVGRHENALVTYNPYKTLKAARAGIPLKYNTCDSLVLRFPRYSSGIVREYADSITMYLSNFDDQVTTELKNDTIQIFGCSTEPIWSSVVRGVHNTAPQIAMNWSNGVLTLNVAHNGPVDIVVHCSGSGSNRSTVLTTGHVQAPAAPVVFTGTRQYEAECFDYKSIASVVTNGYADAIRNYTGQGYLKFGTSSNAICRDSVSVYQTGSYDLQIRYASTASASTIDLYVNGIKNSTPSFVNTSGSWRTVTRKITLNKGWNILQLKANASTPSGMLIDNLVLENGNGRPQYNFTNDVAAARANTPAANDFNVLSGSAGVVATSDAGKSLHCYSVGGTNATGVANLELFPTNGADYQVAWKVLHASKGGSMGVLLRGTGNAGACPFAVGLKQGYLFQSTMNEDGSVTLTTSKAQSNGLISKCTFTSSFQTNPNQPCWLRASAFGNRFRFECSSDSIHWEGRASTLFTDETYTQGATQFVWGLNDSNLNWVVDNLSLQTATVSISKLSLPEFSVLANAGPSNIDSLTVSAEDLMGPVYLMAPPYFEIALLPDAGYTESLEFNPVNGTLQPTKIFVRLKTAQTVGSYTGDLMVYSDDAQTGKVSLSAVVRPLSVTKSYTFDADAAKTTATSPPAQNATVAANNGATAGVVGYTDANALAGKLLKAYSGGARNATGVINLSKFVSTGTDYSVTWKQCLGSAGVERKVGFLLRGDASNVGDASTGYVQGLQQGYLFIVYTKATGGTEFRMYLSTPTYNALTMKASASVGSLQPTAGQPVWYRASVSGVSPTVLRFDYSTDSSTWISTVTYTESAASFTEGSTQLVWGLGANDLNWFVDNLTFNGLESNYRVPVVSPETLKRVFCTVETLTGFQYDFTEGPSQRQVFALRSNNRMLPLTVQAPANFELSLDDLNYASSLTLYPSNRELSLTNVQCRLKAALDAQSFSGNVQVFSGDTLLLNIPVSGQVRGGTTRTGDHFKSRSSGNKGEASVWSSSGDGVSWMNATSEPTSAAASVLLSSGHTIQLARNDSLNHLNIAENATLLVEPGVQLTLNQAVVNNGSLKLLSDRNATATLLIQGPVTGTGKTIVQQHVGYGRNWYLSAPVAGATVGNLRVSDGSNQLYRYQEPFGNTMPWLKLQDTTLVLEPMGGYVFNPSTVNVVEFEGSINVDTLSNVVTHTASQAKAGFNLVGNPYPSYLDWSKVHRENVSATFWYRTTYKARSTNRSILTLKVNAGSNSDQTIVHSHPSATDGFDSYDSRKMFNNSTTVPEIYTVVDNQELVINGFTEIPYDVEIPLGLKIMKKGTTNYSIQATQVYNFLTGTNVLLLDAENPNRPVVHDLTNGVPYAFTSDSTNTTRRFSILFKAPNTYAFDTYNAVSGIGVAPSGRGINQSIPPMQAFWVLVNSGTDKGRIAVDPSMVTHAPASALKLRKASVQPSIVRLNLSNSSYADETVLSIASGAKDYLDEYDSPKMFATSIELPQLFTSVQAKPLAINSLESMPQSEIPLRFASGMQAGMSLRAAEITGLPEGTRVWLVDHADPTLTHPVDLTDGVAYRFETDATACDSTRFGLLFRAVSTSGRETKQTFALRPNGMRGWLADGLQSVPAEATVYDASGILLTKQRIGKDGILRFDVRAKSVYLVRISDNRSTIVFKSLVD